MPQPAILLLSQAGLQAFGRIFGAALQAERGVSGTLVSYHAEGVWFQDARLQQHNKIVLVKWSFINGILSEIPPPEPSARRRIGFQAVDLRGKERR